jgi:hypothetical protein
VDDHYFTPNPYDEDDNKPVNLPSSEEQGSVPAITPEPGEKPRTRSFTSSVVIIGVAFCCVFMGVLYVSTTPNVTAWLNPVTSTPIPSITPVPTITPTATITATVTFVPLSTMLYKPACVPWNQVSKADVGKDLCVTGTLVQRSYVYSYANYSDSYIYYQFTRTDPNAFRFTWPYGFYPTFSVKDCVEVTGVVKMNGGQIYMKYPNVSKCTP